ncbi:hypothetical protein Trydic_g8183 [Trypoxylus dichotomus]
MFIDQHKEQRMLSERPFLNGYRQNGNLFSHTVTSDEVPISYSNAELKQLMRWCYSTSPKPKKFQANSLLEQKKMMTTVFWNEGDFGGVNFKERGTTVAVDVSCGLLTKLRHVIQNRL